MFRIKSIYCLVLVFGFLGFSARAQNTQDTSELSAPKRVWRFIHCAAALSTGLAYGAKTNQKVAEARNIFNRFKVGALGTSVAQPSYPVLHVDANALVELPQELKIQIASRIEGLERQTWHSNQPQSEGDLEGVEIPEVYATVLKGQEAIQDYLFEQAKLTERFKMLAEIGVSGKTGLNFIKLGGWLGVLKLLNYISGGQSLSYGGLVEALILSYWAVIEPYLIENKQVDSHYAEDLARFISPVEGATWSYHSSQVEVLHNLYEVLSKSSLPSQLEMGEKLTQGVAHSIDTNSKQAFEYAFSNLLSYAYTSIKLPRFMYWVLKKIRRSFQFTHLYFDRLFIAHDPESGGPILVEFLRAFKRSPPKPESARESKKMPVLELIPASLRNRP